MWMLAPLSPVSDASLLMWNAELQVCVEILGKHDLSHVFSIELIIDTIVVLHEVSHMFHVLIIDSIIVTCDVSHLLQVDATVVSRQPSRSHFEQGLCCCAPARHASWRCVFLIGLPNWEAVGV